VLLSQDGALLSLGKDDAVTMKLAGANRILPAVRDLLPGTVNYFIGNDPKRWRRNVPTYAKVEYANVYSGIDLVYYGNHRALEYDLVVAPNTSVKPIRLKIDGAKLKLETNGDLKIEAENGTVAFHRPIAYQLRGKDKQAVQAQFTKIGDTEIGFTVGSYDHSRALVLDPQIEYSSYFNNVFPGAIAVDNAGSAYITGTAVGNLPVTPGAFDTIDHEGTLAPTTMNPHPQQYQSAFVTKFSPDGQSLVYSTYLGGTGGEGGNAIAVDGSGNAYITGITSSDDFPAITSAFQSPRKMFVAKLNSSGSGLVYAAYLGGTKYGGDYPTGIAVNAHGEAYVTGIAGTIDFPVTAGAYQITNKAAGNFTTNIFVTKFNADATGLIYSTYIGGSGVAHQGYTFGPPSWFTATDKATGNSSSGPIMSIPADVGDRSAGITLDSTGNAYVVGSTGSLDYPTTLGAFQSSNPTDIGSRLGPADAPIVTKLNPTGTALVYSTYLGGSGTLWPTSDYKGNQFTVEYSDHLLAIAVDAAGDAYVVGSAGSPDYPVTAGAFQKTNLEVGNAGNVLTSVVSELNPTGTDLIYSTYLGGSKSLGTLLFAEGATGVASDNNHNVYVAGNTDATDFPVTSGAFGGYKGGPYTSYFTILNTTSSQPVFSTYLGGSAGDRVFGTAYDGSGVYLTGDTSSYDFPVTPHAFQQTLEVTPKKIGDIIVYGTAGFVTKINVGQSGKILTRATLTTSQATSNQTTLVATVTPFSVAAGHPLSGTVMFYNNGAVIGGPVPVGNPVTTASLTTSLATGATSFTCDYSGDAYYAASNCPLQPDFSIALADPTVTVQSGGKATTSATLTSIGGFTDGIGVACTNVPAHITCKINPATTGVPAYGSTSVSIYLDTTPPPFSARNSSFGGSTRQFAFLLLPAGLLVGGVLRKRPGRFGSMSCAVMLSLVTMGLSGCVNIVVPYKLPSGTYTIPITGTAQSSGITHTVQLTLVVTP